MELTYFIQKKENTYAVKVQVVLPKIKWSNSLTPTTKPQCFQLDDMSNRHCGWMYIYLALAPFNKICNYLKPWENYTQCAGKIWTSLYFVCVSSLYILNLAMHPFNCSWIPLTGDNKTFLAHFFFIRIQSIWDNIIKTCSCLLTC